MKNKILISFDEMVSEVPCEKEFLQALIDRQILFPAQRDPMLLFFSKDTDRVRKMKEMISLGFSENDLKRIVKEIGLPNDNNSKQNEKFFSIGEFCKKYNLSARQIKYWEDLGLFFPSVRSKGGIRLYNDFLIIHIRFIQYLQELGFELSQIKDIIQESRTEIVESRINRISDIIRELRPILKNMKRINK